MASKDETIFGVHAVDAVLSYQPQQVIQIWVSRRRDDRLNQLLAKAEAFNIAVSFCSSSDLEKKVRTGVVHQGVIAVVRTQTWDEKSLPGLLAKHESPVVLVLDQVTDPHNLGACLRTANGFGVACVIVPQDGSASLTPVARKVACGAASVTPLVRVKNLARTLRKLQESGLWLVGTAGEADCQLKDIDLTGPIAILMGAEGAGLRALTRKHCDYLTKIDLSGTVSSLNVSVATGVCLYEIRRQRF